VTTKVASPAVSHPSSRTTFEEGPHNIKGNTVSVCACPYLCREGVSVDAVLRAPVIPQAVVNVYLLELVLVGKRSARHVDVVSSSVVHSEHNTVSSVGNTAAHLREHSAVSILFYRAVTPCGLAGR
jgi:hypothetical protein